MLYISIGILGATVMPHNLYLHSSIVQTRMYGDSFEGKKEAIHYATIDSTVALMSALFINAAILIMAAAVFHRTRSIEKSPTSATRICCSTRCSVRRSPARCSRWRCSSRGRTPR